MIGKMGNALTVGLSFTLLAWVGFDPDPSVTNSEAALSGLRLVYVLPPVALEIGVFLLLYTFPLDRAKQEELRRQIEERDATGGAPLTLSTK